MCYHVWEDGRYQRGNVAEVVCTMVGNVALCQAQIARMALTVRSIGARLG